MLAIGIVLLVVAAVCWFDLLIVVVGWRYLLKPYVAQRQARAIAADHALHGIEDHDGPTQTVIHSTERPT